MEDWKQAEDGQRAVMAELEENIAPEPPALPDAMPESHAPITSEEMDAVIDELVAIASRMAAERAAQWSGRDPAASQQRQLEFARHLLEQEDAIKKTRPDFDLEQMLREQSAFRALILAGEPVERAMAYVEPGEGVRKVEMEVVERIKRRGTRPQAMGSANRPPERSVEERLDDEEMGRIDAQLKRGHKVYLNY